MIPQRIFSFWANLYVTLSYNVFFNCSSEGKAFFIKIRKEKVTYKNVSSTKHSITKGRRYLIFAWKFLRLRIIFYTTFKSIRSLQLLLRYTFIYVLYHWWNHIPVRDCCWWCLGYLTLKQHHLPETEKW